MAGLARMANRDHRFVEIQPGDTVIVSASPIPGNEEYVSRTIDNLFKAGANVFYHTIKRAHVSGHASQEELKLMLGLTKPKVLHPDPRRVPDAGPARPARDRDRGRCPRTCSSSRTACPSRSCPTARPIAASPSRPATSSWTACRWARSARSSCATRALANDGMFMIVVTVDKQTGNVIGRPEIITRGFVHGNERDPIIESTTERVIAAIENPGDHISEIALLKAQIKDGVSRYLYEQTGGGRWSSRSWSRSDGLTKPADSNAPPTTTHGRAGRDRQGQPAARDARRPLMARVHVRSIWASCSWSSAA